MKIVFYIYFSDIGHLLGHWIHSELELNSRNVIALFIYYLHIILVCLSQLESFWSLQRKYVLCIFKTMSLCSVLTWHDFSHGCFWNSTWFNQCLAPWWLACQQCQSPSCFAIIINRLPCHCPTITRLLQLTHDSMVRGEPGFHSIFTKCITFASFSSCSNYSLHITQQASTSCISNCAPAPILM